MTDRALQDEVIRALADAPYRGSTEWRRRRLADPDRVERYARFLARHFYFERIVQFFKYSRALARVTGRWPEAVLKAAAFEALFATMVLGSRETAEAVTRLVTEHVAAGGDGRIPYLKDLLRYQEAMMVVEAGPRVWRDPEEASLVGSGGSARQDRPAMVEGTVLLELSYDLPAVLPKLLQPWSEVPQVPERQTRLLVARSPHGRVAVARGDATVAAVMGLADGTRTVDELAAGAGLAVGRLQETLRSLVELGAVGFSTGS
ncbi:MAG TPA: hypothetical protein VM716_04700 [Gemmatimonadales bacterium]|nr:hypothetical protein [Gemmatimonadales bacterium]